MAAVDELLIHISINSSSSQNILVPDCFYTFTDLRKEFKTHFPTSDLKALNVHAMADCILPHLFGSFVNYVFNKFINLPDLMQHLSRITGCRPQGVGCRSRGFEMQIGK